MDGARLGWFAGLGPFALLLVAGVCVLATPASEGFGEGHHGYLSSHGVTLGKNFELSHAGFLYDRVGCQTDGAEPVLSGYNRFPATTFVLIHLAIEAAGDDLGAQVVAARVLMKLFFVGSLFLGFLTLRRIGLGSWVTIAATLAAFSGYYLALYSDMVFNDATSLFGVLLAAHGIVQYEQQQGSTTQLRLKVIVAVLFGWQVLALLAAWAMQTVFRHLRGQQRSPTARVFRHEAVTVFAIAGVLTASIVAYNLWNEQRVMDMAWSELPTVESLMRRTGQNEELEKKWAHLYAWDYFVPQQLHRIGRMSVPALGLAAPETHDFENEGLWGWALLGSFVLVIALLLLWRNERLRWLIPLALCGLVWAVGMKRFSTFHDFQSPYYVGLPLVLWAGLFDMVRTRFPRLLTVLAVLTAGVFAFAHLRMAQEKRAHTAAADVLANDYAAIRDTLPSEARVWLEDERAKLGGAHHGVDFYLSGYCLVEEEADEQNATHVIALSPSVAGTLTPKNDRVHAYQRGTEHRERD